MAAPALACVAVLSPTATQARSGPAPGPLISRSLRPRSEPLVPPGSATTASAPTVGLIGDSVAQDYATFLAPELGRRGKRVVDAALSGCTVGTLAIWPGPPGAKPAHTGCTAQVAAIQQSLLTRYHPKIILWHSLVELYHLYISKEKTVLAGGPEWERRVSAQWDETLRRVTRDGAKVIVILPVWQEGVPSTPVTAPGSSVEKLRRLYVRWIAAQHGRVGVVDVAPFICPSGPPCRGFNFRPDAIHFGLVSGPKVAAYLAAHVPELR